MIQALKFRGRSELAFPLACAMAEEGVRMGLPRACHVLVPVPLSARRLARRGFNQAELLARQVAARLGMPVAPLLARTGSGSPAGPSVPQSLRSAGERRRSLRGAFSVTEPARVRGLAVAVVDDVYTTGATMDEAARALLRAGASQVWGLVAAAGVLDRDLPLPEPAGMTEPGTNFPRGKTGP